MKIFKRILVGLLIVVVLLVFGFVFWANDAYQPDQTALDALSTDAQVEITLHDGFITFEPVQLQTTTGFLFYPGGRVDYRAYAPVLRMIAERGYLVSLVKVRLNLAFFDINAGDRVLETYPWIEQWVVGGHSLGGVAAATYAENHLDMIHGIVFWASYPANDFFKNRDIPILSVYGTNDGLADGDKIEETSALLPESTSYFPIAGGNHAQFGSYGAQSGDNPATITAYEQWSQVAEETSDFLEILRDK